MVTFDQLMLPLIKALVNLGGSGSIDEIYEEVVELEKFDEGTLAVLHNPEKVAKRRLVIDWLGREPTSKKQDILRIHQEAFGL